MAEDTDSGRSSQQPLYPDLSGLTVEEFDWQRTERSDAEGGQEVTDQNTGIKQEVTAEEAVREDQSETEDEHIKMDLSQSETTKIQEDQSDFREDVEADQSDLQIKVSAEVTPEEVEGEIQITEEETQIKTIDELSCTESLGEPVEILAVPDDEKPEPEVVVRPQTLQPLEETRPKTLHTRAHTVSTEEHPQQSEGAIKPFTEEQLKSLYYSSELEGLPAYVDEFLKVSTFLYLYILLSIDW